MNGNILGILMVPFESKIFTSFIIFIGAYIAGLILKKTLDFVFLRIRSRITKEDMLSKTRTIRSVLKNFIDIIVFFIAVLMMLSHWGLDILPLLTGAGILGLGFSLGAQSLFKDLIAGFFIITENQFNVGDKIKVDKYEGTVYKISLRSIILKDKEENYIYIPNSLIASVVRYKRETKR